MNKVILIGNLANDPELTQTQSGKAKCSFRIACQRRYASQNGERIACQRRYASQNGERIADFISVVCWDKLAENCAKYLAKGRKCAICGEIQSRSYEAQDGSKRFVTEVNASEVEFIGERQKASEDGAGEAAGEFTEVSTEELPF